MAELFLVDSSTWIFALRRRSHEAIRQRIDKLLELDVVATCGPVALELLGGTANETEFVRLKKRLKGLHWLPVEDIDWEEAARLVFSLRRVGVTVPFTDVLLAAVALRYNAILLHADHDFDLIAMNSTLKIESLVATVSQGQLGSSGE